MCIPPICQHMSAHVSVSTHTTNITTGIRLHAVKLRYVGAASTATALPVATTPRVPYSQLSRYTHKACQFSCQFS
eukprot:m.186196 g.186196  ORF g.186196 m.186196 type:complete len:75 (-) comp16919_c0_seq5:291-515(-)